MKFDDVKKLQQKKYRQQSRAFLLEGEHLIQELDKARQHNPALANAELWITEHYQDWPGDWRKHLISERQMKQLSETKTPQGIVAVVPMDAIQPKVATERAVYLYQIQDPGNLGTILRTLAWFGGFRCLLSPGSVDPFNSKVLRASMGATFHVPIEQDVSLESLPQRFQSLGYLDMQGAAVTHNDFHRCDCLIFGNEARGVPRDALAAAQAFTIAGQGRIESLNLASTVNMCVYELQRG
ncbi:rRNA methyltransferase [Bacterioplanes sanyensis]|uniref:rRNA methyltransferase n=1 Tax=Bacterioplanes sanyensis TaxID=1249553 RepID=A0A222FF93_9GAMM|nr:RNA methyltransferase [Bacterioplanes sanyensis]ASP37430.1 rRNA methyltransferase [Bacterioplanes sanyensis]